MKIPSRLKPFVLQSFYHFSRLTGYGPHQYIFIIAHMRSGSTLLNHLLLSDPTIIGCGESNQIYTTPHDLPHLAIRARSYQRRYWQAYRYVVEQVNRDEGMPPQELLTHPEVKLLFLAREPQGAIASFKYLNEKHNIDFSWEHCSNVYIQRVRSLIQTLQNLPQEAHAIGITYDELLYQTVPTLSQIQQFLTLKAALSETYQHQKFTGRRGDPMPLIYANSIVRNQPTRPIQIDVRLLEQAQVAYQQVVQEFAKLRMG